MGRLFAVFAFALLLTQSPWAEAAECTASVAAGDVVQDAIDEASEGDVVCLESGLHELPTTLVIQTSLTLQGPQAGVDPRPLARTARAPGGGSEAILDGSKFAVDVLIRIMADDVVLEGLEVRGGEGDLIESLTGTPTTGTRIRHCIIHESTGDEGIQLRGASDVIIENNRIFDTAGDAINVCCGSSNVAVRYNEIHAIQSTNGALYFYDNGGGGASLLVADNLIYSIPGDAIKLGIKGGADVDAPGGRVFRNMLHSIGGDGVSVYTSQVTVEANEFSGVTSTNGVIYLGYAVDGISIVDNLIHDNGLSTGAVTYGVLAGKNSVYPTGVEVSGNCFENNEGGVSFNSDGGLDLDAESNYWGAVDGPSGVAGGGGDSVSVDVDYEPFLASMSACAPDSDADGDPDQLDCAPGDATIFHGADELCDTVDRNCDGHATSGATDKTTYYLDADGDGAGDAETEAAACEVPIGSVATGNDCDDADESVHPDAEERCDIIDRNCDGDEEAGAVDAIRFYSDSDGDGAGAPGSFIDLCSARDGYVAVSGDCDDDDDASSDNGDEVCDGIDNDCDGEIDDVDADEDGFVSSECGGNDCDDRDYRVNPEAVEACFDGIDNDCDGEIDEDNADCQPEPLEEDGGCSCRMGPGSTGGQLPGTLWTLLLPAAYLTRRRWARLTRP